MTDRLIVEANEEGEAIIQLPDQLLIDLGWTGGDSLEWTQHDDGTVTLSRKEVTKDNSEKEWVLVECISTFRQRYLVQVPQGKEEYALDTVTMNQAKEFSQLHLGETIVSHRVLSEDEAVAQAYVDNDYLSAWTEDQIKNNLFTYDNQGIE
jgi:hypothetical protein